MSDCEIIPLISFHTHYFRDLEPFYLGFICSICVVISCIGFPTTASSRIRYKLHCTCYCRLFGRLFADRGYINQNLFEMLVVDNIHFLTKIKKNINSSLMSLYEKILLRNRSVIEFLTPNSLHFMSEKKIIKV